MNQIFSLLVYSRILYPGSKKETYDNKDRFFEPFHFSLKDLYRSLDYFNEYKEDIQTLLWNSTKDKYNRNASTSYYDCTNYYFEINYNDNDLVDEEGNILEAGYRKRGVEKNKRPDPIVEMGLLMDSNGIPMSYDIFPGNESEKTSLRPIINRTKAKFGIDKVIVVADRGLNTSDNMFFLAGKNDDKCKNMDGYVYGQSVRGADDEFKSWVLNPDGYINDFVYDNDAKQVMYRTMILNDDGTLKGYEKKPVIFRHKSRVFAKTIQIKKDGVRKVKIVIYQKQLAYFSQKYAEKQKRDRQMMVDKAKDLIKNPIKYTRATSYGAAGYINNLKFDKKTGEVIEGLDLSLDLEKINEEAKYDGYYSIVTSEMKMTDQQMRDTYRGLAKIEDTFKVSKTNLESRPVYVWTKEHIEAHFLTCFVSLVIIRLLEHKLNHNYSVERIIESIKKYCCIYSSENKYLFYYRDEIIKELEKVFNINLNNKILTKKFIKDLLKY
jgi:transposase